MFIIFIVAAFSFYASRFSRRHILTPKSCSFSNVNILGASLEARSNIFADSTSFICLKFNYRTINWQRFLIETNWRTHPLLIIKFKLIKYQIMQVCRKQPKTLSRENRTSCLAGTPHARNVLDDYGQRHYANLANCVYIFCYIVYCFENESAKML